jgi:hypothetical protein
MLLLFNTKKFLPVNFDGSGHTLVYTWFLVGRSMRICPLGLKRRQEARFKMLSVVLWIVTPYCLVGGCQRFGGNYRLHLQGTSANGGDTFLRNAGDYMTSQPRRPQSTFSQPWEPQISTLRWILGLWGREVDGAGSGSCLMACFGISSV